MREMAKDVDLIKERLPIADFLRGYLTLTPAGRSLKALCPFHGEKTPSFIVSPDRGRWHCFGCGEGGDVITFVMKYENLEFPEALRFLAEKAGIQLASVNPQHQREFGVLYDINEETKKFFQNELSKSTSAIQYFKSRGLTDETIKEFELGFSPGGEGLVLHLIKNKFDVADAMRAGVIYRNSRGLYRDRFEGRVMFPIMNHVGKTVAFTGRIFGEAAGNPDNPKYVNSPETPVFNKSKVLYGLHKSKSDIAHAKAFVVVEGQMDFLMSWQCGVKNVVAISGTGLTEHHLERLTKIADTAYISFDNDEAGRKALERTLMLFNAFNFHTKVLSFDESKDPAEALQKDPEFMSHAIESAKPAFTFLFSKYFSSEKVEKDLAFKKRVITHLLELIASIQSPIESAEWMRILARESRISEQALQEELQSVKNKGEKKDMPASSEKQTSGFERRIDMLAKRLVSLAFTNEKIKGIIDENKEYMPRAFLSVLENPAAESALVFQMQSSYLFGAADENSLIEETHELIRELKLEFFKDEQEELRRVIKIAEANGNEEKLLEATRKFQDCAQKINELSFRS